MITKSRKRKKPDDCKEEHDVCKGKDENENEKGVDIGALRF